eukprot:gnl/MRDRNA2_/MRDRNA2_63352_c0_seq1.p1 gnl/MRDRNA2_/MRDRNA2_63352_c0~~gnl/MRDRNA2_/MRDRNA2_63352_c0_seq1.p1  ORF type:complete len:474 (+),score=52.68 gnl/MRDRNA2_/MRDRNA2_63352_c0_seq1:62-1483(+)
MSITITSRTPTRRDAAPIRARPSDDTTVRVSLKARVQENASAVASAKKLPETSNGVASSGAIPKDGGKILSTTQGGSLMVSPRVGPGASPRRLSPRVATISPSRRVMTTTTRSFTPRGLRPSQPQTVTPPNLTKAQSTLQAVELGSQGDVLSAIKTLDTFLSQAATSQCTVQRQVSGVRAAPVSARVGSVSPCISRRASSPVHLLRQPSVTRQVSAISPRQVSATSPVAVRPGTPLRSSRSNTPLPATSRQARSPPPQVQIMPPASSPISQNEVQQQKTGPAASTEQVTRQSSAVAVPGTSGPVRMNSMQPISQFVASSSFPKVEPPKVALRSSSSLDLQYGVASMPLYTQMLPNGGLPQYVMTQSGYQQVQWEPRGFSRGGYAVNGSNSRQNAGTGKSGGDTPPRYRIPSRGSFSEVVFSSKEGNRTGMQQMTGGSRPLGPLAEPQMNLPEPPDPRSSPMPPVPNPSPIPEW